VPGGGGDAPQIHHTRAGARDEKGKSGYAGYLCSVAIDFLAPSSVFSWEEREKK
jgi:hypothetical protein